MRPPRWGQIRPPFPGEAPFGDEVQRRLPVGGQLAEDLPGFAPSLASGIKALACDPAGDGDCRAGADAFEARLNDGVDRLVRVLGSLDRLRKHVIGSFRERQAKLRELVTACVFAIGRYRCSEQLVGAHIPLRPLKCHLCQCR